MELVRALLSRQAGQAVIATILLLGTFALLLTHNDVPAFLISLDVVAVSVFFGTAAVNSGK